MLVHVFLSKAMSKSPLDTTLAIVLYGSDNADFRLLNRMVKIYVCAPRKGCTDAMSKASGAELNIERDTLPANSTSARKRRQAGLERFVLALSNQQLLTGLAILVVGFSQICSMSVYHFNIVASLAWFSSATQLATLGVLKTYLLDHPTMRNLRVFAMVTLLVMLLVAQLPAWSPHNNFYSNFMPVSCFYSDIDLDMGFFYFVTLIPTMGFLFVIYTERIARLYAWDSDWNISDSLIELLVKGLSRNHYREPNYKKLVEDSENARKPDREIRSLVRAERERDRFADLSWT